MGQLKMRSASLTREQSSSNLSRAAWWSASCLSWSSLSLSSSSSSTSSSSTSSTASSAAASIIETALWRTPETGFTSFFLANTAAFRLSLCFPLSPLFLYSLSGLVSFRFWFIFIGFSGCCCCCCCYSTHNSHSFLLSVSLFVLINNCCCCCCDVAVGGGAAASLRPSFVLLVYLHVHFALLLRAAQWKFLSCFCCCCKQCVVQFVRFVSFMRCKQAILIPSIE